MASIATGCMETERFAPTRQGEAVEVEGGRLTVLSWCGATACRGGLEGRAVIWVKACATSDNWEVSEGDFLVVVPSTYGAYDAESIPRPEAFGYHTLDADACAEGTLSFILPERPEYLFYYGSGFRVRCLPELSTKARRPANLDSETPAEPSALAGAHGGCSRRLRSAASARSGQCV